MITKLDRLFIADQLPDVAEIKYKTRRFYLERLVDVSGVSGTGIVAVGVEFPSGFCVLEWQTETATTEFAPNIDNIITVHGHGGNTKVYYLDAENNDANSSDIPAFEPLESSEQFAPENSNDPVAIENYHAPTVTKEQQIVVPPPVQNSKNIQLAPAPASLSTPQIQNPNLANNSNSNQEKPERLKAIGEALANMNAYFEQVLKLLSNDENQENQENQESNQDIASNIGSTTNDIEAKKRAIPYQGTSKTPFVGVTDAEKDANGLINGKIPADSPLNITDPEGVKSFNQAADRGFEPIEPCTPEDRADKERDLLCA